MTAGTLRRVEIGSAYPAKATRQAGKQNWGYSIIPRSKLAGQESRKNGGVRYAELHHPRLKKIFKKKFANKI